MARFEFTRDYENDFLEIANISVAASIVELSASSRLYNRWLKLHGARMDRKTIDKKQRRVWTGIKAVPEDPQRIPIVSAKFRAKIGHFATGHFTDRAKPDTRTFRNRTLYRPRETGHSGTQS